MRIWVLSRWEVENHLAGFLSREPARKVGIILIAGDRTEMHELEDEVLSNEKVEILNLIFPDDDTSFTPEIAKQVWEFVRKTNPDLLIVSCQEGKSRSPAIALAIDTLLNGREESPFFRFWGTLNRRVFEVMKEVGR